MYQTCCKKCESISLHIEQRGDHAGLYCNDCGSWVKWLSKDEKRAFEHSQKCKKQEEDRAVYVIFADTHESGCGAEIEILGVADNQEDMDKIVARAQEEHLEPQTEVIRLNKYSRTYIGGYYE